MQRNLRPNRAEDPAHGAGWRRPESAAGTDVDAPPAPPSDPDTTPAPALDQRDSPAAQPERGGGGWRRPLLTFLFAATAAVAAGSGLFNPGPTDADVTASYNSGFAVGSEQTRDDLEADFLARADATSHRIIREAELRGIQAVFDLANELRTVNFNDGYAVGYAEGVREVRLRNIEVSDEIVTADSADQ